MEVDHLDNLAEDNLLEGHVEDMLAYRREEASALAYVGEWPTGVVGVLQVQGLLRPQTGLRVHHTLQVCPAVTLNTRADGVGYEDGPGLPPFSPH